MINTIFYFAKDQNDYDSVKDSMNARTISFVPIGDGKGLIYKNGVLYTGSSTSSTTNTTIDPSDPIITGEDPNNDPIGDRIKDVQDRINATISEETERLTGLIDEIGSDVEQRLVDMLGDANWVRTHVNAEGWASESNFGEDDVKEYLQRLGYLGEDGTVQYSEIYQTIDLIRTKVETIETTQSGDVTALQAQMQQYIDDVNGVKTAMTNLDNVYVKTADGDDIKDIIKWLYSGFRSGVNEETAWADIVSAAHNTTNDAIANLHTEIIEEADGKYVAKSAVGTLVQDEVNNKISQAGLVTEASLTDSSSTVYATLDSKIQNGTSALRTDVQTIKNNYVTTAALDSTVTNKVNNAINSSGVLTESDLSNTSSTLYSSIRNLNNDKYASISTAVTKDSSGNITSSIKLVGDKVTFDTDFIDAIEASLTVNAVTAQKVVATTTGNNGIWITTDDQSPVSYSSMRPSYWTSELRNIFGEKMSNADLSYPKVKLQTAGGASVMANGYFGLYSQYTFDTAFELHVLNDTGSFFMHNPTNAVGASYRKYNYGFTGYYKVGAAYDVSGSSITSGSDVYAAFLWGWCVGIFNSAAEAKAAILDS